MGHDPDAVEMSRETFATVQQGWQRFLCRTVTAVALTAASLMAFAVDAEAQEAQTEPAIRVTFLGTGTPVPNPRQFGPQRSG